MWLIIVGCLTFERTRTVVWVFLEDFAWVILVGSCLGILTLAAVTVIPMALTQAMVESPTTIGRLFYGSLILVLLYMPTKVLDES